MAEHLVPLEEAQRRVLARCQPSRPTPTGLADALGCVTAAPIAADHDVPPFANTAMDGYAVRAADTNGVPTRLAVVGTQPAGRARDVVVGPGQAVRIMTGAPMPDGADAVVMVEHTEPAGEDGVVVDTAVEPGTHIRRPGEDVRRGEEVFPAHTVLGPAHLGVLASLGVTELEVFPRPRAAVLSTGDELVAGGGPLAPGQIHDSNRLMLLALLRHEGFEPVDLGLADDDEEAITAALEHGGRTCDLVLTTGGVSVGDYDYVKAALDRLGHLEWMQVAIKPAKPLALGAVGSTSVLGLPGNPVSALVSFELFARPALRQMAGHPPEHLHRPRVRAIADEPLRRRRDGKVHFARVTASMHDDGRLHLRSTGGQGSHQLAAMARANALAVLPDGDGVAEGAEVDAIPLA